MIGGYLAGRCRSVGCAVAGVRHMVRTQRNAWFHAVATAAVIGLGLELGLGRLEWCWMMVAVGAVWVAEALNTAVELLADAAMPEWHELVGRAKDVAAGGVLVAAVMSLGIGLCIMGPHLLAHVR